jgi:4-hydroxy-tetrahydrodipicolinate reductase
MTKIIIHGCIGQMGCAVQRAVHLIEGFEIVSGIDSKATNETLPFPVFQTLNNCNINADAVIDFSTAEAIPNLIEWCRENRMPLVMCTTGLSDEATAQLTRASEILPIFKSANMSLGINLMLSLLERASAVLGEAGFNIEIIEKHHSRKVDAPSGTAFMLANALNKGGQYDIVTDRTQRRQRRPANEIGISAVRGGTIVGEHTVIFAGQNEVLEISHSVNSRDAFANGALQAAEFIARQKPGFYNMNDLLSQ